MWSITRRHSLILSVLLLRPLCFTEIKVDEHFCGFKQKCTGKNIGLQLEKNSCCRPCECADTCKEKGTCCRDKTGLNSTVIYLKQECMYAGHIPNGFRQDTTFNTYYTRTQCPGHFNDSVIKEKCESSGKAALLEDITFVSSMDGLIIYKNRFCGLCHGETGTKAWEIEVTSGSSPQCSQIMPNLENVTVDTVTQHLLSSCVLRFKRPHNVDLRSTRCISKTKSINQCNQTGKWDIYDSNLEKLCVNPPDCDIIYSERVFYLSWNTYTIFGNIYCYLCNEKANVTPESCDFDSFERFTKDPLFTLINQNLWAASRVWDRKQEQCMTRQLMDTFFNRCRTLYCPKLSLPYNGRCVPFAIGDKNYLLVVRLVPQQQVNTSETIKNELKSKYFSFQKQLGFELCELCNVVMYFANDRNETDLQEVYVKFIFSVTKECNVINMWSKFTFIEKSSSSVNAVLNTENVRFEAFWVSEMNFDRYETVKLVPSLHRCRKYFTPERGAFCPKVKLTIGEYESVLKEHVNAKELVFAPSKDDMNGTIFVCLDKYIVKRYAAGVQIHVSGTLHMITILSVAYYSGFWINTL